MLRSVTSVVGGLVVTVILVSILQTLVLAVSLGGLPSPEEAETLEIPGPGMLLITLVVDVLGAIAGGWFTAWLAPARQRAHVFVLAGILLLGCAAQIVADHETLPIWLGVARLLLAPPAAIAAGLLVAGRDVSAA